MLFMDFKGEFEVLKIISLQNHTISQNPSSDNAFSVFFFFFFLIKRALSLGSLISMTSMDLVKMPNTYFARKAGSKERGTTQY